MNTDLSIKHKGVKNRISHEFNNLFFQSDSILVEHINNQYIFTISINLNIYKFILHPDYPFKPPEQIFYNNINYKKILLTNTPKIRYYLDKFYRLNCLCCSSLTFGTYWTPAISLGSIINEINHNIKLKKKLFIYILCDYIKIKYKCEFAHIDIYLF